MRRSVCYYSSQKRQNERKQESQPAIELKFWVFRLYDNNPKKVCVQGYCNVNSSDPKLGKVLQCWRSSPIVDRLAEKRLITDTGREYCLKGSMDIDQARVYNYSEEIIAAFKNGFPADWKNLLRQEHKRLHSTVTNRVSNNFAVPFLTGAVTVLTNLANLGSNTDPISSRQSKADVSKIPYKFLSPTLAPRANHVSPQPTPMNIVCKMNNRTQITSASSDDGFRVSKRSGRLIKEPLQSWMGERIVYDVDGNPVEAHSITTKEQDKPDVSDKLAAICDGLGVGRVEPSKQAQRRSFQPLLARELDKKRRSSKDGGSMRRQKLVDYSDSEDSFLDFVDRVQLSPEPRKYNGDKSLMEVETPIPLKHKLKNRRAIFSPSPQPSDDDGSERESEEENTPKPKMKRIGHKKVKHKRKLSKKVKTSKKKKVKSKGWSEEEIKRLQIAIGAASTSKHIVDWKVISRCVSGGQRSVKECQEQAEKLNFKSTSIGSNKSASKTTKIATKKSTTKASKKPQKPIAKKKKARNSFGSSSDSESESPSDDSHLARLDGVPLSPASATKKTTTKRVAKKRANQSDGEDVLVDYIVEKPDSSVVNSDEDDEGSPAHKLPKRKEPIIPKNKRWTADETQRLKNILKLAVNPQTEHDWEVIAKAFANQRTGQACREQAEKIKWKPTIHLASKPVYDDTPDKPCCSKDSSDKKRRTKRSMADPDFFGGRDQDISCLELDPDDSLFDLLNDPDAEYKKMRRPHMMPVLNETIATRRRSSFGQNCSY